MYYTIEKRWLSIFMKDTSGVNKNTLSGRLIYLKDTLVKFKSPRIIIGYGFGDMQKTSSMFQSFRAAETWSCENSVLYYCWKYGIVATALLFGTTIVRILHVLKSKNKLQLAIVSYIISWIPIGLMSGNFNSSFSLSLFAGLLSYVQYAFQRNYEYDYKESRIDDEN